MLLYDFITQDELDELPEDSETAFIEFVHIAQRRLRDFTRETPISSQTDWEELNEARHSFTNIILAAAKRYGIEPFDKMEVPTIEKFDDTKHKQFRADLDHYITQLVVGNTIRGRRDSVAIPQASRDKLRTYLRALRDAVEKADLGDGKRASLLEKLDMFERELEKRRLSLLELTRITLAIAAVPGGVWASVDVAMKLVNNVMHVIGEAKAAEDEHRQLLAPTEMRALSAPRKDAPEPVRAAPRTIARESFSADLDDEIPF